MLRLDDLSKVATIMDLAITRVRLLARKGNEYEYAKDRINTGTSLYYILFLT